MPTLLLTLLNNKITWAVLVGISLFFGGFYCGYKYEKNKFTEYKTQILVEQNVQKAKNEYLEEHAKSLEKGTQIDTQGQIDSVKRHYQSILDSLRKQSGSSSNVSNTSRSAQNIPETCPNAESDPKYIALEQRAAETTVLYNQLRIWYNQLKDAFKGN